MKLHISLPASRRLICLLPAIVLALSLFPATPRVALAANPPPVQYYYITLPEDDLLTLFDENQDTLSGYAQVISPIRSATSIAIGETGTLVYWDQWEDGSYDADIANPGANVYNAGSNPDGTQIWGDGDLTNGCPPRMASGPNPCAVAADDQFVAGDVIILDNDVEIKTGVYNVLDQFGAVAYNNNNGTNNWASSWDETGDNDSADSGDILVTSNRLQFDYTLIGSVDATDNIVRQVSIPVGGGVTASSFARLKFTLGYSGVETDATDEFRADVYNGSTWTTLATYGTNAGSTPASGSSLSYDIGAYVNPAGNTQVRFYQVDNLETAEYWYVD
ncbi:MAG: hypothetical protein GX616_16800, partial [Planctomycetes bacterium]|nr:hypothetical protein [Planctomycetota bacterium]